MIIDDLLSICSTQIGTGIAGLLVIYGPNVRMNPPPNFALLLVWVPLSTRMHGIAGEHEGLTCFKPDLFPPLWVLARHGHRAVLSAFTIACPIGTALITRPDPHISTSQRHDNTQRSGPRQTRLTLDIVSIPMPVLGWRSRLGTKGSELVLHPAVVHLPPAPQGCTQRHLHFIGERLRNIYIVQIFWASDLA